MSAITYLVTGNTFARKDKIKKAGGRWNSAKKAWEVTLHKSDSLWQYDDLIFTPKDQQAKSFGYAESGESEGLHQAKY